MIGGRRENYTSLEPTSGVAQWVDPTTSHGAKRTRYKPRLPDVIRQVDPALDLTLIKPVEAQEEFQIYRFHVADSRSHIHEVTAIEDRFSITLETPIARINDPQPAGEVYRSLMHFNHDIAFGTVSAGPLNAEPPTEGHDSEAVFYQKQIDKSGVPTKFMAMKVKTFADFVEPVKFEVLRSASLYNASMDPMGGASENRLGLGQSDVRHLKPQQITPVRVQNLDGNNFSPG